MMAYIIFSMSENDICRISLLILKNQSVLDLIICFIAALCPLSIMGLSRMTGLYSLDLFICHVWYSHYIYRYLVTVSALNTALLTVDRYLAVCHPLRYIGVTCFQARLSIGCFHVVSLVASLISMSFAKLENMQCLSIIPCSRKLWQTIWSIINFVLFVAILCLLVIVLYINIIYVLYNHQRPSSIITQAKKDLTWTAFLVNILLFMGGFGTTLNFLSGVGLVSPGQSTLTITGRVLVALKSAGYPTIYLLFLPAYRRKLFDIFRRCKGTIVEKCGRNRNDHNSGAAH